VIFCAESGSRTIGLITLGPKPAGARSAGNPHAACEEAGAGNGVTDHPNRARRGKPWIETREILRTTAPVLDPTNRLSFRYESDRHRINTIGRCPTVPLAVSIVT
jgi:hypothetical protein